MRSGLVVGTLIALVVSGIYAVGGLERTELRTLDLRFLVRFLLEQPGSSEPPVMVVAIDQRSLDAVGPWPWSYETQARLVQALTEAGAEAVGLTYLLPVQGDDGVDQLERALREHGQVILAAASQGASDVVPQHRLVEAAATVGSIDLEPDLDGIIRRIPGHYPSATFGPFSLTYARAVGAEQGLATADRSQLINYRPPANDARIQLHRWIPTVSAVDVLDGVVSPHVTGKYVLVGVTSPVAASHYNTPLLQQVPGVYIHAFALRSQLVGDLIRSTGSSFTLVAIAIAAVAGSALAFWLRPWVLTLMAIAVTGLTGVGAVLAFVRLGLWVKVVPVLTVYGGVYLAGLAYAFSVVDRDTRRVRHLFRRYVAPEVVDRLLRDPGDVEAGRRADVTILFADIRGFTAFAERTSPEHAVRTLDRYLQAMADSVLAHGGMLDKYIGDAVMAVFGAPLERSDHASAAVLAALDIRRRVGELSAGIQSETARPLGVGIGIHSGEAVVGSIGSQSRREYTAIGDAVNVASRLEEAAGPGEIVVSHSTVVACGMRPPAAGAEYRLRGRHDPVIAYTLSESDAVASVEEYLDVAQSER